MKYKVNGRENDTGNFKYYLSSCFMTKYKHFSELHICKIVMLPAQKAIIEYNNNVLPKVLEKNHDFLKIKNFNLNASLFNKNWFQFFYRMNPVFF